MTEAEARKALDTIGFADAKAFQAAKGLKPDGIVGPITAKALEIALAALAPARLTTETDIVPLNWMPACRMDGIVVHWTAGSHKASPDDRTHYHILIEADGGLIRGTKPITANATPIRGDYAAHTLNHNSGQIGVSLCCMAMAKESPFSAGRQPMTREQWDALPHVLADLCRRYLIPINPRTVLSHAEVQDTLGIKQRGKWDISRLAFDPAVKGAKACGDIFRARAAALLT